MDSMIFHALWTLFMMAAFVALIVWVMAGKHKREFDDASRIPLEDDSCPDAVTSSNRDNDHE